MPVRFKPRRNGGKKLPIKPPQLYDVHVMCRDRITKITRWVSTPKYNTTKALAKSQRIIEETRSSAPYGTFVLILKNGVNPLEYLANRKRKSLPTETVAESINL